MNTMIMMINDKVYEAVVLDEELGAEEASVKATTVSTTNAHSNGNSSTIVPLQHSFKVDEANSDSLPLHRMFLVIGFYLSSNLLMTLNVSHTSQYGSLVRGLWVLTDHTKTPIYSLITKRKTIDHNSDRAMYIAYISAELSFILLILMNLYFCYGAVQIIYVVGFVFKFSEFSNNEVVVYTLNAIHYCNFATIFFLVMDQHYSKADRRFKAESTFAMIPLWWCRRLLRKMMLMNELENYEYYLSLHLGNSMLALDLDTDQGLCASMSV